MSAIYFDQESEIKANQCKTIVTFDNTPESKIPDASNIVVLLHCGCLSLIPFNPFIEFMNFRICNNSSSPDVLNIQASISISPNYVSKSKTASHCQLLLHDCTNAAVWKSINSIYKPLGFLLNAPRIKLYVVWNSP